MVSTATLEDHLRKTFNVHTAPRTKAEVAETVSEVKKAGFGFIYEVKDALHEAIKSARGEKKIPETVREEDFKLITLNMSKSKLFNAVRDFYEARGFRYVDEKIYGVYQFENESERICVNCSIAPTDSTLITVIRAQTSTE